MTTQTAPAYEWLLLPAVGTFLVSTFCSRAAMRRGFEAVPLALLTMSISFLLTLGAALLLAPAGWLAEVRQPGTVWIAVGGGTAGGAGLCLIYAALRQRATGPVATIGSMSILVPIAFGLILGWDAAFGPMKWIGALLALAGTAAIHLGKGERVGGERFHWVGLALGALLCFGLSQTAQKYITVAQPHPGHALRYAFMLIYYLAGMGALAAYLLASRQAIELRALPYSAALGLNSFVQFGCMLVLLQHVSTALVYITFTGGGLIVVLLVSVVALKERYGALVWLGCALGLAGIVLMRL